MKIRVGFVSNSSSSSFVCDVCGASESGWDACLEDFDMCECVNGHIMCKDEMLEDPEDAEDIVVPSEDTQDQSSIMLDAPDPDAEEDECDEDEDDEDDYEVKEKYCPICNFIVFSQSDAAKYLEKKTGISREEAFEQVKKINKRRKKLYDQEYVMYACTKQGINTDELLSEIKNKFKSYSEFSEFLHK